MNYYCGLWCRCRRRYRRCSRFHHRRWWWCFCRHCSCTVIQQINRATFCVVYSWITNQMKWTRNDVHRQIHKMSMPLMCKHTLTPQNRLSTIDKFIWRAFFSRSGKNFVRCVVLSGQIVSVWLADTQTSAISYNVKHLDYLDSFFLLLFFLSFSSHRALTHGPHIEQTWDDSMRGLWLNWYHQGISHEIAWKNCNCNQADWIKKIIIIEWKGLMRARKSVGQRTNELNRMKHVSVLYVWP